MRAVDRTGTHPQLTFQNEDGVTQTLPGGFRYSIAYKPDFRLGLDSNGNQRTNYVTKDQAVSIYLTG